MALKVTQGNWVLDPLNKGVIHSDNGEDQLWKRNIVANVFGHSSEEEAIANMNLISASKDLYEALEGFIKYAEDQQIYDKMGKYGDPYYKAVKAIKKAKGEQDPS